ncbi:MAG: S4 domain-containing protein, partial [Campylobacter sp.]
MRFDLFTASRLNISRNKAAELIKSGKILLNGKICSKPSFEVGEFDKFDGTDGLNLDITVSVNLSDGKNGGAKKGVVAETKNLRGVN